jgi:hypothetical protein
MPTPWHLMGCGDSQGQVAIQPEIPRSMAAMNPGQLAIIRLIEDNSGGKTVELLAKGPDL